MSVFRQRLAISAVLVTALTVSVTAGCASAGKQGPSANPTLSSSARPTPTATAVAGRAPQAGDLLISNGTATVTVNGSKVSFPTTVTDAAWSPDRSRIAFIDADGNLDSSHPDGTGQLVLAKPASGATFSDPAWGGDQIFYTRTTAAGASNFKAVHANGWVGPHDADTSADYSAIGGENAPTTDNSSVSVSMAHLANGLSREAAFQHKGANGPEVWIVDQYQRGSTSAKLAQGSQPAVSPDGTRVAYVGTDGQIHLVSSTAGQTPQSTVISKGLTAPTHLAWAPDGGSIAFSTASGIESIQSNGTAAKPGVVRELSKSAGVATYAGAAQDVAERLSSTDPIAGAISLTQSRYRTTKTYRVLQSSVYAYSVALANPADPVAAELGAGYQPILYTGASALDPRTKAELLRMFGAPNTADGEIPTVTIVGDTSMVSTAVENAVKALGYKTARVSGADRYAVNAAAVKANSQSSNYQSVLLVSGDDPAVLTAASLLSNTVLLTRGSTLPSYVSTFLSGLSSGTTVYVVGDSARAALGSWSKSGVKVVPLSGADAAQTSVLLAKNVFGSPSGVVLVDPAKSADGDVAVTAALEYGYAILLVDPAKGLEPATRTFLDDSSAGLGTTLAIGPSGTLSDPLVQQAMGAAGDAEGIMLGAPTYSGS
jgi:hypothetical protein